VARVKAVGKTIVVLSTILRRMAGNGDKVSISHLCRIFNGERDPSIRMLLGIAKALKLSLDETWGLINKVRAKEYWHPRLGD